MAIPALLRSLAPAKLIFNMDDKRLRDFVIALGKKNGIPDPFLLGNLLCVLAHVLAPGALPRSRALAYAPTSKTSALYVAAKTAFQKTADFTLMVSCINYILLVGESGTGKSPVRREASTVSPPGSAEL